MGEAMEFSLLPTRNLSIRFYRLPERPYAYHLWW